MRIIEIVKWNIKKINWQKRNSHNKTHIKNDFNIDIVSVGKNTYGTLYVLADREDARLRIGSYCSIGPEVTFLLSREHNYRNMSTYPFKVFCMGEKAEARSKGDIAIDDDVWLGYRATILSGVHIAQGAVVAAGAVVTKDVPPYAIVGGVPAKVIKYRFSEDIINKLLEFDFSKLDETAIAENISELYKEIESVEQLELLLNNLRR